MKVIILAAGRGTRMKDLTSNKPKPLIEVNGKPFLYYLIENVHKAGFNNLGIIVNYKKEQIREFLDKYNIRAKLIQQIDESGVGAAIKSAKEFVGNENFISLMGDNYYFSEDLMKMNNNDEYCYMHSTYSHNPEKYGVIVSNNGFVSQVVEKPKEFITNTVSTGLYKLTPEIFNALDQIDISERGECEIPDAFNLLAKQGKVKVIKSKKPWLDFGCPEDIPKVNEFLDKL